MVDDAGARPRHDGISPLDAGGDDLAGEVAVLLAENVEIWFTADIYPLVNGNVDLARWPVFTHL